MPPVEIKSDYEIKVTQGSNVSNDVDKKFWTDVFVPAFANSIKIKKVVNTDRVSSPSSAW
jgi:hypothetical protein